MFVRLLSCSYVSAQIIRSGVRILLTRYIFSFRFVFYSGFSLLNVIRLPLSILPISLTAYKEGLKSHERVKKYLDSPEAVTPQMTDAVDGILVDIKNATFSWSEGPSDGGTDTDKAIDSDKNAAVRNSMNAFLVAGKEDPSYGAPVLRGVTLQVCKQRKI